MAAFTLATVAGAAAGLAIGAVATIGVTLAAEDHTIVPVRAPSSPSSPYLVQYAATGASAGIAPSLRQP
ncbi:DUF2613 family protein [Mycobacterium tilburgii]|uniref:DUF2613 family protein n=1 Tax=Mycobacterium tilburgii TaxID=44467 RepID=UPI0021B383AD|nr:DUF2613 family protein [Mycobacterium tilburgii]